MKLNRSQELAAKKFHRWWKNRTSPTFEISGAAGTGKTSIVRYVLEAEGIDLKDVLFVAYVGKATLALRKNGLDAKTIHSAICDMSAVKMKDANGNDICREDGKPVLRPVFTPKSHLPARIKAIVVDEGSMVPERMCEWILQYDIPVIVLGDLNQLEPVFGKSFFLQNPDAILTEIMRQGKDSYIPILADKILKGEMIRPGKFDPDGLINIVTSKEELGLDYAGHDVTICARNATRRTLNHFIREVVYGIQSKSPVIGDKLICRKNNWTIHNGDGIHLVNGLMGKIRDIDYEKLTKHVMTIDFQPDDFDEPFFNIELDRTIIDNNIDVDTTTKSLSLYEIFEYGYSITCHLAQGSQYNSVIVKYEPTGGMKHRQRWLYTAVTRAIERLTLVI